MLVAEKVSLRAVQPTLFTDEEIRWSHRHFVSLSKYENLHVDETMPFLAKTSSFGTCKTPFHQLERTDICKMRLLASTAGKYLLVRCIEMWVNLAGWQTLVEDHEGNMCKLCVHNYSPKELFPLGTALIIKEPQLLETPMEIRRLSTVICKSVTDILLLMPSHPLFHLTLNVKWVRELPGNVCEPLMAPPVPSTPLKWLERGNGFFDNNHLILAREAYFLGSQLCTDGDEKVERLLKLNILAVHSELEYFEKAIDLGKEIVTAFPDDRTALLRLGKAYYKARKFAEAFDTYEKLVKKFPEDREVIYYFQQAQERNRERSGEFDWPKLQLLAALEPPQEIDCADYDGPVEIKIISGKGKGLVLTKDVEKNTLLFVSKALASTLDPTEKNFENLPSEALMAKIFIKLAASSSKNPNLIGVPVFNLCSDPDPTLRNEKHEMFCNPEFEQEPVCDMEKLKNICYLNHRTLGYWSHYGGHAVGLFNLPSYLNHSCEPNVNNWFYNDVLVATAKTNLKTGTELTISYVDQNWKYEERRKSLKVCGFKCRCKKCQKKI